MIKMYQDYEPRSKMHKVTLIMEDGQEKGPVKIVGGIKEVETQSGPMLQAKVYANPLLISNSTPGLIRFMAVYTNFKHKKGGKKV